MRLELSFPPRIKYGVNSSGNPGRKDWIPDQVRNDKIVKPFLRHWTSVIQGKGELREGMNFILEIL
jgi:hypothetical protein